MMICSLIRKFILFLGSMLLSFAMIFGAVSVAHAQAVAPPAVTSTATAKSAGRATQQEEKKKSLSFEDELVEGATAKPELFYLFQKKNFNYKRLIRLRENFIPEMRRTSEDVQRGRGSN